MRTVRRLTHRIGYLAAASIPALVWSCGGSEADETDMRVDDDAVMDTTPAGTPAPPSLPSLAEDERRQVTVTLDEWSLILAEELMPAGEVTFQIVNAGSEPHRVRIDGPDTEQNSDPVAAGATQSVTISLEPGTYRLFCPDTTDGVSHAERGMSLPLVVR